MVVKKNILSKICVEYKYQILAAIAANVISLSHGAALGWLSPMLLILQSKESPLDSGQVTVEEASWLGSIFCIGGITGNLLLGFIANTWGRKKALCFLAFPQMMFWLLVIFGNHIYFLYAARIFAGIAGGGTFVSIPLFISDIADKRIRGTLGSFLVLSVNMGTLLGFVIGAHLPYHLVPKILIALPVTFFLLVICLYETPQYLYICGKEEDAKASLAFYRNLPRDGKDTTQLDNMFTELKNFINDSSSKSSLSYKDFCNPEGRKAMILGIGMVSVNILSGCFVIINYTANIFKQSGAELDPNTSAIIVAANQILGTYTSTILVDKVRRRLILATTTCGAALGFIGTGLFSFFAQEYDLSEVSWIPVASLSFAIFIASAGLIPITFVVLAELLPQKIRPLGSGICNCILNILAFGMLKIFPLMMIQIGLHGVMWVCGSVCIGGLLFILLCIPETKGKSI